MQQTRERALVRLALAPPDSEVEPRERAEQQRPGAHEREQDRGPVDEERAAGARLRVPADEAPELPQKKKKAIPRGF